MASRPTAGRRLGSLRGLVGGIADSVRRFSCGASMDTFVVYMGRLDALGYDGGRVLRGLMVILTPFTPRMYRRL